MSLTDNMNPKTKLIYWSCSAHTNEWNTSWRANM